MVTRTVISSLLVSSSANKGEYAGAGFDLPLRRVIAAVPLPSAVGDRRPPDA